MKSSKSKLIFYIGAIGMLLFMIRMAHVLVL